MKIISGPSRMVKVPLDGNGSDIVDGALIAPGTTAGTDMGVFHLAGADGTDAVGVLEGLHDFSVVGDATPEDGLVHPLGYVNLLLPGCVLACEYDTDGVVTCDSSVDTTSVTATSLEDNIDSSWVYFVSGTGIGQLAYVDASASGDATIKAALATAHAENDTFIKVLRLGHALLVMNSARTKLTSTAAVGTWTARVLRNQIRYNGSNGWEDLSPITHHGLVGLNGKAVKFRAIVVPCNTFFSPID